VAENQRTGEEPRVGARLWTTIAAQLRGTPRVEALVLASITHYAAGDAIRAGIALDAAHQTAIETGCRFSQLAKLMHGAVRAGIPPQRIRDIIDSVDAAPPPTFHCNECGRDIIDGHDSMISLLHAVHCSRHPDNIK